MLKYQRLLEQLSVSDDDTGNSTSASSDGNVDASPRMQLNTMYYASSEEDSTSSLTSSDTCDESAASYCRATSLHHNNRPPNVLPFVSPASSPDQHSPLRFSVNSSPSHQRTARRPSASASTSACCGMAPKLHGQLPPSTNRMGPSSVSESTPLQSSGAALTSSGAPDTITASTTHLIKVTSTTEEIQLHKCTSSSSSMDSATDYGSVSETPSAMRERWLRCEPLFGPVVVSECGSAVTSGRSSRRTSWFSGQPAPPVLTTPFAKRRDLQRAGELFARRRRMFGHCGVRKPHTATASSPMVCPVNSSFASTARDVPHRTCPTNLAVTVRLGSPIKPTEQRCSLPPVAPKSSPGSPNGPPSTPGRGRQLCAMVDDDDDDDAERLIDWG